MIKKVTPPLVFREFPMTSYRERTNEEMRRRLLGLGSRRKQLEKEIQAILKAEEKLMIDLKATDRTEGNPFKVGD